MPGSRRTVYAIPGPAARSATRASGVQPEAIGPRAVRMSRIPADRRRSLPSRRTHSDVHAAARAARRSSPAARGARSPSPARSRSRCSSACTCTASARARSSRRRSSAASLTLAAVVAGNWIPGSPLEPFFSLTQASRPSVALCVYGFVASVLPVWLLLVPARLPVELPEDRHHRACWSSA